MLALYAAVLTIACGVSAAPQRVKRFDAFDSFPFSGGYAYAGPYSAFAGSRMPFYNPFGFFMPGFQMPTFQMPTFPIPTFPSLNWYEGPNVCETKKVMQEPEELKEFFGGMDGINMKSQATTCKGNNEKYVCWNRVSTTDGDKFEIKKYQCCYGFVRPNDGRPGCVEIDLRYLMPTLRNMGASNFVKLIGKVGMIDDFHNNNYTVFCPPNSALEAFQKELEDEIDNEVAAKLNQKKVKKKSQLYNVVTSHLFPGFLKTDDVDDEKMLASENSESKIRINVYYTPFKIITANCVPILSGDHFARNGIVHVVEKMLMMPSRTVADIIAGDTQFSILKRLLSQAGLVQTLRNPNGSYTLFAPTDSALKSDFEHQSRGSGNRCTVSVMKHHIIDHVICSSALPHQARSLNMIGELLSLSRDQNNKLYVDDVQIVVRDLMATNGVVHIIDGILSTRQTKPLSQVLEESGLYEFLSLIESANLKSEFDSLENVTFFVPTDEVMKSIPPRHLKALLDYNNQSIENVLKYHVAEGQVELSNSDQLLHSRLENSTIRFQVLKKFAEMTPQVLAQCATVLSADIKLCGGTLHVIDKLLLPPKLTITEFLESIEGFSTLVLLLRTTGLDKRLNSERASFTLFAPTDDAFHQMGDEAIFKIIEDVESARALLKMHIMLGTVCCSQLSNDLMAERSQIRAMDGTLLNLERSIDNILRVGGAHVVDCDIITTNGVIHMVDTVLSHDQSTFLGGGYLDNLFVFV